MAPKKARDRKRQTKINFSPASQPLHATKSSAATAAATAGSPSRPPRKQSKLDKRALKVASKAKEQESTSEDELAMDTERSMHLGKPRGMFNGPADNSTGSISSEEEQEVQTQPKSRKRRRAVSPMESEEGPTVEVVPRKRQRRAVLVEIESQDESQTKEEKKRKRKDKKDKRDKKRRKEKESTPEPVVYSTRRRPAKKASTPDDDDGDDDDLRRPNTNSKQKATQERSPSVEEDQSPPRSARRKLKRRRPASDDDDEDEAQTTPKPKKTAARESSASDAADSESGGNENANDEEQEDLEEDLAFLRSSPVADRGRLRSTHDKPKNKRQEALEALKRRRAGTSEPSSATPGRRRAVVVDSDSESDLEIIKEEQDSNLDEDEDEEEPDRDANAFDMFQEDQEDEQFIDDDMENAIGEPSANDDLDEIRLGFSILRAKTKDLFRHAVEWMVMKKIHPGFESTKHVYTLTFRKLDDEVKGLAGSKYTSAAWTTDFTRAIRARPDLIVNDLSAAERDVISPHCEACNRTNHTASSELLLQGQPYNPDTLEPVASDSDSDSGSDSDSSGLSSDSEALLNGEKPTYNFQRERIPPESHRFPVGSTCKANAQVAHTLYHWRYHLYQWVKDYLKAEGHLTPEKIVKRDAWSDRKREKTAHKIVDAMEAKGQIRELWHSYKNQVTAAVEADNEYRNGWGRYR
ncbi:hypothetical protein ACJQWK_10185 [Exserohilum turcicum]|uniref:DUF4211 domain-containing protein n=1 Tax=Exserohilum turcicum (strain 28A) TaxID=671987 RepID=R0IR31_EXST2|nr:uncharacterized protein SETTUDRAFT_31627 [Exserohilum turcica Et28A]EOA87355.1 hypothetical protein SETTUDRAFT_31627 [Exserohilum turcica Et28A]